MFEAEVAKGSAWLDKMCPGWYKTVSINSLNLMQYETCSLGQTLGGSVSRHLCDDFRFSSPYGFTLPFLPKTEVRTRTWYGRTKVTLVGESDEAHKRRYSLLTSAWIQEILRRRSSEAMLEEAEKSANKKS